MGLRLTDRGGTVRFDQPVHRSYAADVANAVRVMVIRILLYAIGGLCLLAVAITAIGYALPQAHVVSRETALAVDRAAVFSTITDVAAYPSWRTGLTKVDVLANDPLKWREHQGSDAILFEVVESRPPELLRVRIADPELPFGGTWIYELSAEGDGTKLRITEQGEVFNPVFRFVSRFVVGHTATIDRYMADLQRRLTAR